MGLPLHPERGQATPEKNKNKNKKTFVFAILQIHPRKLLEANYFASFFWLVVHFFGNLSGTEGFCTAT